MFYVFSQLETRRIIFFHIFWSLLQIKIHLVCFIKEGSMDILEG